MSNKDRYIYFKKVECKRFKILKSPCQNILLEEVSPLKKLGRDYESFSLLFSSPLDEMIPQGTYNFHNDEFGETQMFLTPINFPQGAQTKNYYEAVFSYTT